MLNKKGFVLVETLVVAVFSSIIFAFLYASIVPINGIYEEKIAQEDDVDVYYAAYNIRNFLYNDASFRQQLSDAAYKTNYYLNFTYITCNEIPNLVVSDDETLKNMFSVVGDNNYCNNLMEKLGLRVSDASGFKDYYRLFYIKGISREAFIDYGIGLYRSYNKITDEIYMYSVGTYNVDVEDTIEKAIKKYKVEDAEDKAYLVLYNIYTDSIAIIDMTRHDTLDDCYTYQFIPSYTDYYRYSNVNIDINNRYKYFIFNDSRQRYDIFSIKSDSTVCINYFSERGMSNAENYCQNKFNGDYFDSNALNEFVNMRFAERINENYAESEVAIIDYDSSCSRDIVIPDTAYGRDVTVIGPNLFSNLGIINLELGENIKIIDKNAFENHDLSSEKVNEIKSYITANSILDLSGISS